MKTQLLTSSEIEDCKKDLYSVSIPISGLQVVTWTVFPSPDDQGRLKVIGARLNGSHVDTVSVRIPVIEKPSNVKMTNKEYSIYVIRSLIQNVTNQLVTKL